MHALDGITIDSHTYAIRKPPPTPPLWYNGWPGFADVRRRRGLYRFPCTDLSVRSPGPNTTARATAIWGLVSSYPPPIVKVSMGHGSSSQSGI